MRDIYTDSENDIHPTASIGAGVVLGKDNKIGAYVVIKDNVIIGDRNYISPFVCIGEPGEYRDKTGSGKVVIGNGNHIREFVSIQGSVLTDKTVIGNDCFIMDKCHIAHDNVIGNLVTIAPLASLGGSVKIGDYSNLGQGVIIHPRLKIGCGVMLGMNCTVTKDVPDWQTWVGTPAKFIGMNHKAVEKYGHISNTIL